MELGEIDDCFKIRCPNIVKRGYCKIRGKLNKYFSCKYFDINAYRNSLSWKNASKLISKREKKE